MLRFPLLTVHLPPLSMQIAILTFLSFESSLDAFKHAAFDGISIVAVAMLGLVLWSPCVAMKTITRMVDEFILSLSV